MKAKKQKLAKLYLLLYYSKAIFLLWEKGSWPKKVMLSHTWQRRKCILTSKKLNFIAVYKCNPIQSMLYIQCYELVIAVTTCSSKRF